ncbi:MAG: A24 family peptidase [Planctomycetota bacterium]
MVRQFFPDLVFGWAFYSVLVSLLAISSVIDFRSLRIPKALTGTCLALGLAFNLARGLWLGLQDKVVWKLDAGPWLGTFDGILFSVAGFATAFAIFFVLWFLKAAGGGDVKLFASVGAWVGPWYIVFLMVGSVIVVVLITLGMMLYSMVTAGFSKTRDSFSHKGSQKAVQSGRRGSRRGPTYSFPLAFATALIMLLVLSRDLGLTGSVETALPPVSQAR